jgi:hypothetical protein
MPEVNATVSALRGDRRGQSIFERRQRNDAQRGVSTPFGTVDLSASGIQWGFVGQAFFSFSGVWSANPQPSKFD